MSEPKWRITIEGEGPVGDTLWSTLNISKSHWGGDSFVLQYEEFPLYVVEGEVRELVSEPDRSGRGETPFLSHRTGHCNVHGYYTWRETERASSDPTCPSCIREVGKSAE